MAGRSVLALLLALAVAGARAQGDPFTQFNEPASAASVAAGAPSVNIAGVPAAAASATSVPVMGTLAAPLPGAGYAAGYAPAVAAPAMYSGYTGYAPAYPGYAPAPAAPAYDPIAAAAGVTGAGAYAPAAAAYAPGAAYAPAAAAPAPVISVPAAAPAPPPKPKVAIQDGMMLRSQMKEQIPANASALPVIRVPEGTVAKLAYVCDITGQLYISVDREALILCPSDRLVNLAKLSGIKGAKSINCPDNRAACPGNNAVHLITKMDNTLAEFERVSEQWRVLVATAASMPLDRVTITDIEQLVKPAPKPAPAAAAAKPASAPAAKAVPSEPLISPRRRFLQVEDTAAVVETTKSSKASQPGAVQDTSAVVEQISKPKPKIIVHTHIQPLTDAEAESVLGTIRKSSYFSETFYKGASKMGLKLIDGLSADVDTPADEFQWPEEDDGSGAAAAAAAPKAPRARKVGNATDLDATDLSSVALTADELAAQQARDAANTKAVAAAASAGIANGTNLTSVLAPGAAGARSARSGAGARSGGGGATALAAAAAVAAVAAFLL